MPASTDSEHIVASSTPTIVPNINLRKLLFLLAPLDTTGGKFLPAPLCRLQHLQTLWWSAMMTQSTRSRHQDHPRSDQEG
jgi:hypothetical protein